MWLVQFFCMTFVACPRALFAACSRRNGFRLRQMAKKARGREQTGKVDPVPTSVNFATIVFGYTTATAVAR